MTFVVHNIFLMLCRKAKNVRKLSKLSFQLYTALEYFLDHFSFDDNKLSMTTSSLTVLYSTFKWITKDIYYI